MFKVYKKGKRIFIDPSENSVTEVKSYYTIEKTKSDVCRIVNITIIFHRLNPYSKRISGICADLLLPSLPPASDSTM